MDEIEYGIMVAEGAVTRYDHIDVLKVPIGMSVLVSLCKYCKEPMVTWRRSKQYHKSCSAVLRKRKQREIDES